MDAKLIGKELLGCIDLEKMAGIVIDEVIFAALKKVVDDSTNKFDDAAYAMLAPLLEPKAKEAIAELIAKLKA